MRRVPGTAQAVQAILSKPCEALPRYDPVLPLALLSSHVNFVFISFPNV